MKTFYKSLCRKKIVLQTILIAAIFLFVVNDATSQVRVPFKQRASVYSPDKKIYHIKGDFQMIGNTNMTLQSYSNTAPNSNNNMIYVDVDGNPTTVNSSSAVLEFSSENSAEPGCSNIIYAGLYWTGRAHDGESPNVFTLNNQNIVNGGTYNGYTLTITQTTESGARHATYTFTPIEGGDAVIFRYNTWTVAILFQQSSLTIQRGSGPQQPITNYSENSTPVLTLRNPVLLDAGIGAPFYITSFRKNRGNNTINSSNFYATTAKQLDKRKVRLKHDLASTYQTIVANTNDIHYPTNSDGYMYSSYAEVTDYVKQYGVGNYTVADIALTAGNGGPTGFYGGWSMIVVYENSKMTWRDVTVFDGHAYVAGGTTASYELPVSGFNTTQTGPVEMKLGIIAGEGDYDITGDYFEIRPQSNPGTWIRLGHTGAPVSTPPNFFNSSIQTGSNVRIPSLQNNTGLDISMFKIDNPSNSIITNNQKSTTFRYGSTQDTYIISCIAMAVDAYVPDIETTHKLIKVNNSPYIAGAPVLPNDEMEFEMEVTNRGSEGVNGLEYVLPIPYTTNFESASDFYVSGISGNVTYDITRGATGAIVWNIDNVPLQSNKDSVLAKLTYKLKVTTDCSILSSPPCPPYIINEGVLTGTGAESGIILTNNRFSIGYREYPCDDEPVYGNMTTLIDVSEFVATNCDAGAGYGKRTLYYCTVSGATIPFNVVENNFPVGTKYYDTIEFFEDPETGMMTNIVIPTDTAVQYTEASGFPNVPGMSYYAIPPGLMNTCYWEFEIVTVSDFEISVTNATICNGGAIDLKDYVTLQGVGGYQYTYTFYNNAAGTEIIPSSVSPSTTRSYWVRAKVKNSLCISDIKEIVVTLSTGLSATTISPENPTVCPGSGVILTAAYTDATSYQWYKNGIAVTDSIKQTYTATTTGTYTVTYTTEGCTSPESPSVTVIASGPFSASGNVSGLPNNNGITVNYKINDGELESVTTTTAEGDFIIENIPCGSKLEIIPTNQVSYTTPKIITLTNVATNQTELNIIYKLAAYRWWYLSSPYSNSTTNSFDIPTGTVGTKYGSMLSYYDEMTKSYSSNPLSNNQPLNKPGMGIVASLDTNIIAFNPPTIALFNGTLENTGDITVNVSNTGSIEKSGKNLLGNPYSNPIDFDLFYATNSSIIESTYWIRGFNNSLMLFDSYNSLSGMGTNNIIPVSLTNVIPVIQGFWVQVVSSGIVTFDNSIQITSGITPNILRSPVANISKAARLTVKGEFASDQTILAFNPGASDDYDLYDSRKMSNDDNKVPELYTRIGNYELVINGMQPIIGEAVIPLGFRTGQSGSFNISGDFENWDNTKMFLRDNNSGTEIELTAGKNHSFTSDIYNNTSRFSIIINGAPTAVNTVEHNTSIFINEKNKIEVHTDILNAECTVYNTLGQQIASETITTCPQILNCTLEAGVYLVKIGNKTEKVIVK